MSFNLDRVYLAQQTLQGLIRKTDLIYSSRINKDSQIFLKTENLQKTGSFKVRGAAFKISNLTQQERNMGVVACSAGNHAQGVALASQRENIKCTIFMPASSPISKISATKGYGAEVRLVEGCYDDAYTAAKEFQELGGATFIHPFNDLDVIAGQSTIGLEIFEQLPDAEAVIIPIGGGGLASGIAYVLKHLNPKCKVYGVQAQGASSMLSSVNQKKILSLDKLSTFADGIAVKKPGDITYAMCNEYLDDIVSVSDDEIAAAILALMENKKIIAEGAGAVAVAAAMFNKLPIKGKKTVCILSGGNIDINILSRVINRGLLMTGRLCDLSVLLVDTAGQFRDISAIIASCGANVIKLNHSHSGENTGINECILQLLLETRDRKHIEEVKTALKQAGYRLS